MVAVILVGTGCSDTSTTQPTTGSTAPTASSSPSPSQPPPAVLPAGYVRHGGAKDGYTIGLPRSFREFSAKAAGLDKSLDFVKDKDQRDLIASMLRGAAANGNLRLLVDVASPERSTRQYATTVNILKVGEPVPGSFEGFEDQYVEGLTTAGAKDVRTEVITLPAGRSLHATYTLSPPLFGHGEQYIFADDDWVFTVTLTTDRPAAYRETFKKVAQTFRILSSVPA
jgi:hypothetical protein